MILAAAVPSINFLWICNLMSKWPHAFFLPYLNVQLLTIWLNRHCLPNQVQIISTWLFYPWLRCCGCLFKRIALWVLWFLIFGCSPYFLSFWTNCRLGKDLTLDTNSGLFRCAVCQVDQPPADGLSVNSGPFFSPASKPWEGPFLCSNCRKKKDAMEGKRPSIPTMIS